MRKLFHLGSCSTCQRIIKDWNPDDSLTQKDIKKEAITEKEIDEMAKLTGSYEKLFSRRAMKYRSMGLKEKVLSEQDYRKLILDEYTFLKRPVLILDDAIFVGNTKKVVAAAKEALAK